MSFIFQTCKNINYAIQKRPLFYWVNQQFNVLDEDRRKKVGPNRSCAEWILRNGGKVKFVSSDEFEADYNHLPKEEVQFQIQEIDAKNDALKELHYVKETLLFLQVSKCGNITETGLLHLVNLKKLRTLIIFGLPYVKERVKILDTLRNDMKQCNVTFDE
ncbi:hypothetical protein GWI33_004790 [Rhynchophorus ferrugineus]|uniref:ATP synthase subunit s, mitochondrial n=1 Tax=Rhynchophorus ferrugineus TaxID=354439 RepID=A0A834IPL5_RHYFE|nr:hypothetical protein GWI33_004790 [Rhynchophorus ferrugineus]